MHAASFDARRQICPRMTALDAEALLKWYEKHKGDLPPMPAKARNALSAVLTDYVQAAKGTYLEAKVDRAFVATLVERYGQGGQS